MMRTIREKTHILLYVLVFCFVALIVIEWGAKYSDTAHKKRGIIGKIDGNEIRYADFQSVYFNQMKQAQQQREGEALTESETEALSEQVWTQMIEGAILNDFIKRNGVVVSDSEIAFDLRSNPPDFLRQSPSFQTDGKFDENKYIQALNNPQYAKEWATIENVLRSQLPYNKVQSMIASSVRVTESELRQEYAKRTLKLNGQLVYFSPAEFSMQTISVSDDELKAYYDAHLEDFKEPEKAKLAYVNFDDTATKEDSAEVLERLADVRKQVMEGKDFGELAKAYSADKGSAKDGGSVGWFTKGRMVKEFEEACFKGKKGDIVGPIKTQFGYHIIRIDSTRFVKDDKKKLAKSKDKKAPPIQDSVLARHILIKMEASQTTIETARENANLFYEAAKEGGFDLALEKYRAKFKLNVDTTAEIINNDMGMVAGFPDRLRQAVHFAFHEDIGAVTKPHKTGYGFTLFKLISHSKAEIKSLDQVRDRVKNSVSDEKRKELAFKKAQDFRAKMATLTDIKKIDSALVIHDLNNFTANSSIPGVGRDARLSGVLFQIPMSALSPPIKGSRGSYLAQVFTRDAFNETRYQEARGNLKQQLLSAKQQRAYRDWLDGLKKKSEIQDFRADFNL
jgi:peptidyl-prolyl cis-trans isomerase D